MIKYTKDHEWLSFTDGEVTIGLTPHATSELHDIVYIELPEAGDEVAKGDEIVVIDSTKATFGINAPFDGVITEINQAVADEPESVIDDPEGCWFLKISLDDPSLLDEYLDEAEYEALIGS